MRRTTSIVRVVILIAAVLLASACKKKDKGTGGESAPAGEAGKASAEGKAPGEAAGEIKPAGGPGRIALLLPESQTARYEAADRPYFEAKFKELCPDVEVDYSNANQVASDQQQQAEAAIAKGVKVMVLDPVDGDAAGGIVNDAKSKGIPVVS